MLRLGEVAAVGEKAKGLLWLLVAGTGEKKSWHRDEMLSLDWQDPANECLSGHTKTSCF